MLDYKIQKNKGFIRWYNYKGFIKEIYDNRSKLNKYIILTINFNNSGNIVHLINYLNKEDEKGNIDILIIENSTKIEEKDKLKNYIKSNNINNVLIIETIENIGSAGGYALGLEYIFSKNNYEYIFMYEDDILLLDDNTFSEMIKKTSKHNVIYINCGINTCIDTRSDKSLLVQIGLYPVEFLKKVGILNPVYFTRGEDLEWLERFDKIIKKYNYKEIVVNKNYFHPYLKKNNGQTWWMYFSLRNNLYSTFKWFSICKIRFCLITIFLYIWYSFSKLLIEKNNYVFESIFTAMFDFIKCNYSFENNKIKLEKFKKMILQYPQNTKDYILNLDDLNKITNNKYLIYNFVFSPIDRKKIKHSKNIKDFFENGVLTGGYFLPLYPIFMLSKKIVSVDEYDFKQDKYYVSIIDNEPQYIKVIISFLISLFIFIIIIPFIFIRGFIVYFIKYL